MRGDGETITSEQILYGITDARKRRDDTREAKLQRLCEEFDERRAEVIMPSGMKAVRSRPSTLYDALRYIPSYRGTDFFLDSPPEELQQIPALVVTIDFNSLVLRMDPQVRPGEYAGVAEQRAVEYLDRCQASWLGIRHRSRTETLIGLNKLLKDDRDFLSIDFITVGVDESQKLEPYGLRKIERASYEQRPT